MIQLNASHLPFQQKFYSLQTFARGFNFVIRENSAPFAEFDDGLFNGKMQQARLMKSNHALLKFTGTVQYQAFRSSNGIRLGNQAKKPGERIPS